MTWVIVGIVVYVLGYFVFGRFLVWFEKYGINQGWGSLNLDVSRLFWFSALWPLVLLACVALFPFGDKLSDS